MNFEWASWRWKWDPAYCYYQDWGDCEGTGYTGMSGSEVPGDAATNGVAVVVDGISCCACVLL